MTLAYVQGCLEFHGSFSAIADFSKSIDDVRFEMKKPSNAKKYIAYLTAPEYRFDVYSLNEDVAAYLDLYEGVCRVRRPSGITQSGLVFFTTQRDNEFGDGPFGLFLEPHMLVRLAKFELSFDYDIVPLSLNPAPIWPKRVGNEIA